MTRKLLNALLAAQERNQPAALVTIVRSPSPSLQGRRVLVTDDGDVVGDLNAHILEATILDDARRVLKSGKHQLLSYPEHEIEAFVEVQAQVPHLVIVGAGHIAEPLCVLGKLCDFDVTVIDDRAQYANRTRFSQADQVIADDIPKTVAGLPLHEYTYVVLVTRGHSLDVACLLEIIDKPLAYIGMIGSRRRVRAVFKLLQERQQIPQEKLAQVYTPVGLPIGAQTPSEIALCIMAEIINVRRGGQAVSLRDI